MLAGNGDRGSYGMSSNRFAGDADDIEPLKLKRMVKRVWVGLPMEVAAVYRAAAALSARYQGRPFTPDGHLIGSIGEVVAAEALGLTLHKPGHPGHDARDAEGRDVQIKITAGKKISLYATCDRLVVLQIVSAEEAEIVYDGPGAPAWEQAGKAGKNTQKTISLHFLRKIAEGTI